MGRKVIVLDPAAGDALIVLATQIRAGRNKQRLTQAQFAEHVGVSPATMRAIEQGNAQVAVGNVFKAATLAGVQLFGEDAAGLAKVAAVSRETLALLPKRTMGGPAHALDTDF